MTSKQNNIIQDLGLLNHEQAAKYLNIDPGTFARFSKSVAGIKLGMSKYYLKETLQKYVQAKIQQESIQTE